MSTFATSSNIKRNIVSWSIYFVTLLIESIKKLETQCFVFVSFFLVMFVTLPLVAMVSEIEGWKIQQLVTVS